eukprot:845230-Alexandrium_andersonii.AAC.1
MSASLVGSEMCIRDSVLQRSGYEIQDAFVRCGAREPRPLRAALPQEPQTATCRAAPTSPWTA